MQIRELTENLGLSMKKGSRRPTKGTVSLEEKLQQCEKSYAKTLEVSLKEAYKDK